MKTFHKVEMFQKLEQFGVQTIGHIVAMGVVFVLILAWAITGPIFQLSDQISRKVKQTKKLEG